MYEYSIENCPEHQQKFIKEGITACVKCGYCFRTCWKCKTHLVMDRNASNVWCPNLKCNTWYTVLPGGQIQELMNSMLGHRRERHEHIEDYGKYEIDESILQQYYKKKENEDESQREG